MGAYNFQVILKIIFSFQEVINSIIFLRYVFAMYLQIKYLKIDELINFVCLYPTLFDEEMELCRKCNCEAKSTPDEKWIDCTHRKLTTIPPLSKRVEVGPIER